ncbi:hypothetical protein GGQ10_002129 [Salinibacter ruber]|uniref:hypothetical protein n=1 Tax=Salinibacter ruber TaxID=146919 RepID=UPI00216A91F4|nr:hypothetical protein [Salinibacter ruber]MCS4087303.1 hypothetical protein [Salinibacter ruber]
MPDFDNSFLSEENASTHEDALVFELAGHKVGWRASGLALKRASDQGMEVGELLADLQTLFSADLDEEDLEDMSEEEIEEALQVDGGVAQMMDLAAKLVWTGALHFEENAKREVILAMIDPESVGELPMDDMLTRVFPALEDEVDGDMGKGQGETSES